MNFIKKIVKKYLGHFAYFYRHLRYRLFVALFLTLTVGLLDGLGLTMFIPLLKVVSGEEVATGEGMGGMEVVVDFFNNIGIPLTLGAVLLIMLVFFVLKGVATFIQNYYRVVVRIFFVRKLRFLNIDGMVRFRYKTFVTSDSGRIQNTMSGEVGRVITAYQAYFSTLQNWVMMLVYLGMAFLTNPKFAVLVIVGGGLSNVVYRQIYKSTKEASAKISRGGHRFQRELIQLVANFKYLKATGFLAPYGKKLKDSVSYILKQNQKIGFYNALLAATREPLNVGVVVLVIFVQTTYFEGSLGAIILSLLFFYRALTFIMSLQTSWNSFLGSVGALDNMSEFVDELNTNKETYGTERFNRLEQGIRIEDVSFYYDKQQILGNISLTIPKNTTVAFVGESGSGKTTLVNLIAGLMPVDRGSISVDGRGYSHLDLRTMQQRIGYITQDPVIFSDSVFDNVTKWADRTPETEKRFWHALEQAAIADFVRELPKQEKSLLGNNGIQLSGGQKQRLSIARELYKEIDILVMDEATSALDSETERAIQDNIDALKGSYTIIIVAHRLSTIRNADTIYLLNKGKIAGAGNYESLVQQSATFKRMTELQEL